MKVLDFQTAPRKSRREKGDSLENFFARRITPGERARASAHVLQELERILPTPNLKEAKELRNYSGPYHARFFMESIFWGPYALVQLLEGKSDGYESLMNMVEADNNTAGLATRIAESVPVAESEEVRQEYLEIFREYISTPLTLVD